jgi:heat shock protein HslJ
MKKTRNVLVYMLLLSAIILSACAQPAASLAGTTWKLVSYGPADKQVQAAQGQDFTLTLDAQGVISGNAGCNSFSGEYKAADGQFTTDKVASTMMACADPLMQQESAVFATLNGTSKYTLDKDTLSISSSDGLSKLIYTRK